MFRITVRISTDIQSIITFSSHLLCAPPPPPPDGFDKVPKPLPQSSVSRAAGIARATMIFRQRLKQGLIKPETIKGTPLCMDTYR